MPTSQAVLADRSLKRSDASNEKHHYEHQICASESAQSPDRGEQAARCTKGTGCLRRADSEEHGDKSDRCRDEKEARDGRLGHWTRSMTPPLKRPDAQLCSAHAITAKTQDRSTSVGAPSDHRRCDRVKPQ
jgi:hypothetical protein